MTGQNNKKQTTEPHNCVSAMTRTMSIKEQEDKNSREHTQMVKNMITKITALYARSAAPNPENIRRQCSSLTNFAAMNGFNDLRHYSET